MAKGFKGGRTQNPGGMMGQLQKMQEQLQLAQAKLADETVTYTAGDNRLDKYLRLYQIKNGTIVALGGWQEAPLVKYTQYGDK